MAGQTMTHKAIARWLAETDAERPIAFASVDLPSYVYARSWQVQRLTPGHGWTGWHRWTAQKSTARRQLREARANAAGYQFRCMEAIAITAAKEVDPDARPRTAAPQHDPRARRHAGRVRP